MLLLLQDSSQGIQLPLQISHSIVCLLLPLATRSGDNAGAIGFLAASTWDVWMLRILIAPHFQSSTCFTCARSFGIFGTSSLANSSIIGAVIAISRSLMLLECANSRTGLIAGSSATASMLRRRRRIVGIVCLRTLLGVWSYMGIPMCLWRRMFVLQLGVELLLLLLLMRRDARGRRWRRRDTQTRIEGMLMLLRRHHDGIDINRRRRCRSLCRRPFGARRSTRPM